MNKATREKAWNAKIAQMAVGILRRERLLGGNACVSRGSLRIKTGAQAGIEDNCMFYLEDIEMKIFWNDELVFEIHFRNGKSGDQFKNDINVYKPGEWEKELERFRRG